MKVVEVLNKKVWDGFFEENGSVSFLQSWEWGEFQKALGYDIVRIGIQTNNKLTSIALVIKIRSKRGKFLFVPHGPVYSLGSGISNLRSCFRLFRDYLIDTARREGYGFIRLSPIVIDRPEGRKILKDLGFKTAPVYMHAETMWVVDLNKPEDQLMKEMRKTTRYLIKRAGRDGVVVEKRTDPKAVDDFYRLYEKTAKREGFVPFSKKYIKGEFEAFEKTGNGLFLFGKVKDDNQFIASALIIFTKSTAFYHQGASIHTKVPVTYLLQWEAIKEAKKRGYQLYNLWGIIKPGRTPKNWSGLTLFKQGFGGYQIDYLPTQDYPVLKLKYLLTCLWEKLLNWKRGV